MVSSKSNKSLNFAAQLLNVSSEELKMSLTTRKMSAGGSDMRSDQQRHQQFINYCAVSFQLLLITKILKDNMFYISRGKFRCANLALLMVLPNNWANNIFNPI